MTLDGSGALGAARVTRRTALSGGLVLLSPPAYATAAQKVPTRHQALTRPVLSISTTFLIFFEPNKAELTLRAQQDLLAAMTQSGRIEASRIEVNGHTDRYEAVGQRARLSRSRADAVVAFLMLQGVSRDLIEAGNCGDSRPSVITAAGVPEANNRRVEVRLAHRTVSSLVCR